MGTSQAGRASGADNTDHRMSSLASPDLDRALGGGARRRVLPAALAFVALVATSVLSAALLLNPDLTDPLGAYGYVGVFLVNLVSTATLFFPVPGITAAANILIATEASDARFPWLVGVAGGLGMAIGELTAYYVGVLGSHVTDARTLPGRIEPIARRIAGVVRKVMHRWGMVTLFVLAAVPDPFFEIAAVSAGAVRMPLLRYCIAVLAGCLVRGLTLAYLGTKLSFLT
jgi:membrane protein DedA with SNARE-associated domain